MNRCVAISRVWPFLALGVYLLVIFGDVFFGRGTLNTLQNSPAAWPYRVPRHVGWLEHSLLNRFPPGEPADRALWDRPLVNDPLMKTSIDLLARGEFPWLNPYIGLGLPQFGNGFDATFFVGTLAFALLPAEWWDLIYLFGMFICGALTYEVFHRSYGLSRAAAWCGALLYISSGVFAIQLTLGGETFNIYLLTIGVYFVERLRMSSDTQARLLNSVVLGVIAAQAVYATMPEATVATWIMLATYMLIRLPLAPWAAAFQTIGWISVPFLLALLLSAPYLNALLYWESLMSEEHLVGAATLPFRFLPGLVLSYFYGTFHRPFATPSDPSYQMIYSLGVPPIFAAIYWIIYRRGGTRNSHWLGPSIPVVIYVTQAFGTPPLYFNVLHKLPIFEIIWFFRYFASLPLLCASLLTARVIDHLLEHLPTERTFRLALSGWLAVALYFLLLTTQMEEAAMVQKDPNAAEEFLRWNNVLTFLMCSFGALFTIPLLRQSLRLSPAVAGRVWRGGVLSLFVLSCQFQFSKSFYHKQDPFEAPQWLTELRALIARDPLARTYTPGLLYPSAIAGYGVADFRYLFAITPASLQRLMLALFGPFLPPGTTLHDRFEWIHELSGSETYNLPALDLLGVRYLVFPRDHANVPSGEGFEELYRDSLAVIVRNKDARSRFFLMRRWRVLPNSEAVYNEIARDQRQLLETALLTEEPVWPSSPSSPGMQNSVKLLSHTNSSYRFHIELREPRLLVLSDLLYSGHHAAIDGSPVPLVAVNGALIGVPLPAGHFELTLKFRPPFYELGLALFVVGVGGGTLMVWLALRKRRSRERCGPPPLVEA